MIWGVNENGHGAVTFGKNVRNLVYGRYCAICGQPLKRKDFTIDHKLPISKGGTNVLSNLQPAHSWCNTSKGNKVSPLWRPALAKVYDPPLDCGIARCVEALVAAGVDTYESCEGGPGHAYPEPAVRFHGDNGEGRRALAWALKAKLPVAELRRVWVLLDGKLVEPEWELTFKRRLLP